MSQVVRGNIDPEQIKSVGRQGDSSVIQMAGSGTKTAGHILVYDAGFNAVDGGSPSGGGGVSKYSTTFSSATTVTVTHSLGTSNVLVQVFDNSSPPVYIIPAGIEITNSNTVTITFAASQSGSVVVIG